MATSPDPESAISRREFVRRVIQYNGAAAGLAAVAALQVAKGAEAKSPVFSVPSGSGKGKSAIVIGSGIAGLVAAFELSRAGFDCRIFEASSRIGGRVFTIRGGDEIREASSRQIADWPRTDRLRFEAGASAIPHSHRQLLSYCRRLGVTVTPFIADNRAALAHDEGSLDGLPVRIGRIAAALRGRVANLADCALREGNLDDPITSVDRAQLTQMLRLFGGLGPDGAYAVSSREGYVVAPGAGLGKGDLDTELPIEMLAASRVWQEAATFPELIFHDSPMLEVAGGMDLLPKAFLSHLPLIQLNSPCVRLRRRAGGGAQAVFKQAKQGGLFALEADYILIAAPPLPVRAIESDFSEAWRNALASATFSPTVKIGFYSSERFWESEGIYGGYSWTSQDIAQIGYPSNDLLTADGVLTGYIRGHVAGRRFSDLTPAIRHQLAAGQIERLHPGFTQRRLSAISVAWREMPYIGGGWLDGHPADQNALVGRLNVPEWPYIMLGDYLSQMSGWQEGAVVSAQQAVKLVAEHARHG